ncbi:MAG: LamG-like jellyroll fold domain-containing protein [Planctomycetota bacterium]
MASSRLSLGTKGREKNVCRKGMVGDAGDAGGLRKFFIALALATVPAIGLGRPAHGDITYNGFWQLDEGQGSIAHDSSGHGNDGTIYGATWTTGYMGGGLHFRGGTIDDRVQVADSPTLDLVDALVLEAWIKPDIDILSDHEWSYGLIDKWHGRTGYRLTLGAFKEQATPSYLWLFFGFGGGEYAAWPSTTANWDAGEWYHVMATYDASLVSGNVKIYVNDVLEAAYNETRPIAVNTLPLFIPDDPFLDGHPYNRYFPGVMDEVGVGVPEPGALMLLGLGGLAALRRRPR